MTRFVFVRVVRLPSQSGTPTLTAGRSRHNTNTCNIKQSDASISAENLFRTPAIGRADSCGFVLRDFVMSELVKGDPVLPYADPLYVSVSGCGLACVHDSRF